MTANQRTRYTELMKRTKKEVFEIYCRECLGRVHNAACSEQKKSWMANDIAMRTRA